MEFNYRVSCLMTVSKEKMLDHAFHYESKNEITETMDSVEIAKILGEQKTLSQLFEEDIKKYRKEYGLMESEMSLDKYLIASTDGPVTVSFYKLGKENKLETKDGSMKVVAYYDPDEIINYGLPLKEYNSKMQNNKFSLRVGKEVPAGDVNLSYIHSPEISIDENVSLIKTTSVNENVIPTEQIESIVVPDGQGVLSYADIISDNEPIVMRAPYTRFPSSNVNITRRFIRNESSVGSALFYRFELKYHYDSEASKNQNVKKYTGSQIQITDENGNVLGDEYKYQIYVQATKENPKVYWVKIYIQKNTTEEETFKVRYNHVEAPMPDSELESVKKTVQLYSNHNNKNLIEGGKSRVINGVGAYSEIKDGTIHSAKDNEEVYMIEEFPDKDGYKITVPQKSELDPRNRTPFNFKLSAKFKDDKGEDRVLTFGYLTDWVIPSESLLAHEKLDYTEDQKMIGIKSGAGYYSARSLMEMAMPLDMPSLPKDATIEISDAMGNLLYTTTSASDNPSIDSSVQASGSKPPQAKAINSTQVWTGASGSNVRLKNNPISHQVTIFPERQKGELNFNWEASGKGEITTTQSYQGKWKVCQQLTVEQKFSAKTFDIFSGWNFIGTDATRNKWKYDKARDVLLLTENAVEVSGYYNGAHMSKENYIFSACVQVTDMNDDDVIGIIFRVNGEQEYYTFLWEKEDLMSVPGSNGNGVGRIQVNERGVSAVLYYPNPDPNKFNAAFDAETNMTKYMNDWGFKRKKKGIFKAAKSTLPAYSTTLYPNCKFYSDKTNSAYTNITSPNNYNAKGWVKGETYKIRVVVAGSKFQVFIGNDTSDSALGTLVCEGRDETYAKGSYGICNISQENALWSRLKITELDVKEVCTDWTPLTLTSNDWIQVSPQKPADIISPQIEAYMKEKYGASMPYTAQPIEAIGDPSDLRIQVRNDGYVWAVTNSQEAGGAVVTPWKTSDNNKNIKGTGKAILMADGTMKVSMSPSKLSNEGIPSEIGNFSWNNIWVTGGETASVIINKDNSVTASVSVPPITSLGVPLTLPQSGSDQIYKQDGMKSMGKLIGTGGILEALGIDKNIPMNEVLLRIERGDSAGNNKEHRVNYRWKYDYSRRVAYEVDQANHGVNRMRLRNIIKPGTSNFLDNLTVDLVAWTTFEELEAVPVLAIRIDDDRKIEIEKPKVEKDNIKMDSWHMRIKNGRVKKRLVLPYYEPAEGVPKLYTAYPELAIYAPQNPFDRKEVILDYTIPEYNNQEFYDKPIVFIEREHPTILNEKMIQVGFAPIALTSESGISYLEIEAIRMNQSRKLRISDVDAKKGIIYLHDKIRDQDEVIVRYAYEEHWYTYKGFNREGEMFSVDLNPTPGHRFTVAKDGIHEWIPGDLPIRESYTIEDRSSNQLLVKQIHIYLRPTSIWLQSKEGPSLIEGTSRNQSIYHTDEDAWFIPEDYHYDPTMLRLGKVTVQSNSEIKKDMTILDTRSRGGGLDEHISKAIINQVNKESLHHWDIGYFDGEAYQENGVIIIKLPRSLLKTPSSPEGFTEEQIQTTIAKYKGYGSLPIVEYYDKEESNVNVIGNPEMLHGKNVSQYVKELSSGLYFINQEDQDTGDNSILQIQDNAVYGMRVLSKDLEYAKYSLEIKAKKVKDATDRSIAYIQLNYKSGEHTQLQMEDVSQEEWIIYKMDIDVLPELESITIQVNKDTNKVPEGNILVDYINLFVKLTETDGVEIVEL